MKAKKIEKIYRVDAELISDHYIFLEADSINDAFFKAKKIDVGNNWIKDQNADEWRINDSRLVELPVFINHSGDHKPVTCPECHQRTWLAIVNNSKAEIHTCDPCGYKFVLEFGD